MPDKINERHRKAKFLKDIFQKALILMIISFFIKIMNCNWVCTHLTNLPSYTEMGQLCSIVSCRKLNWTESWKLHLVEVKLKVKVELVLKRIKEQHCLLLNLGTNTTWMWSNFNRIILRSDVICLLLVNLTFLCNFLYNTYLVCHEI